jgi:hypothetical protein
MKLRILTATVALAAAVAVPAAQAAHAASHANVRAHLVKPDPMGCCGLTPGKL